MTRKKTAPKLESKEIETKAPEVPQLTFTEDEHAALVEYMNFVNDHMQYKAGLDDRLAHQRVINNIKAVNVIKKIETHIFEFKRKVSAQKPNVKAAE